MLRMKFPSVEFDERIIPDHTPKGVISIHMQRYHFASSFCYLKDVLDIACGAGYGTEYLSGYAKKVLGVDLSAEAIAYANQRYGSTKALFFVMNANQLGFQNDLFDIVCSFETIEHISDVDGYLYEIGRVLKTDGYYIVSTPCVKKTTTHPQNPHHHIEWSPSDFKKLLTRHFGSVRLFGQKRKQTWPHRCLQKIDFFNLRLYLNQRLITRVGRVVGTAAFADMTLGDLEIIENELNNAFVTIAVCTAPIKNSTICCKQRLQSV